MFHQQATVGFGFCTCIKRPADALAPSTLLRPLNQKAPRRNGVFKVQNSSGRHRLPAINENLSSHYFLPEASTTRVEDPRAPTISRVPQSPEQPTHTQGKTPRPLNISSAPSRLTPVSSQHPQPSNLWNPVNAPIRALRPPQTRHTQSNRRPPSRLEPRDEYSGFSIANRNRHSEPQSLSSLQVQASEFSRISSNSTPQVQLSKPYSPKGKEPVYLSNPPMAAPHMSSTPAIPQAASSPGDLERGTPNTAKSRNPRSLAEIPWGPAHPCFPHINPHVPLASTLAETTRIIRVRRDWMIAGDLAPTFSNVYPEILDPWVSEQDFRILIQNVNEGLLRAFNPLGWRAWVDAVLGVATAWLWEDLGFSGAKSGVRGVEAFIERWNAEKGGKNAEPDVRVIPLRRTGYLSVSGSSFSCSGIHYHFDPA